MAAVQPVAHLVDSEGRMNPSQGYVLCYAGGAVEWSERTGPWTRLTHACYALPAAVPSSPPDSSTLPVAAIPK